MTMVICGRGFVVLSRINDSFTFSLLFSVSTKKFTVRGAESVRNLIPLVNANKRKCTEMSGINVKLC